jgi:hypothetical protein
MNGYVQDERYIARSTWMCGAIVSVSHNLSTGQGETGNQSRGQPGLCAVRLFQVCTKVKTFAARRASHRDVLSHSWCASHRFVPPTASLRVVLPTAVCLPQGCASLRHNPFHRREWCVGGIGVAGRDCLRIDPVNQSGFRIFRGPCRALCKTTSGTWKQTT